MALILPGPIRLARGQNVRWLITTTDSTVGDWVAAVLTIRADPSWPRVGSFKVTEPDAAEVQGWDVVLQVSDFAEVSATSPYKYALTATRAQTALVPWGYHRCVIDVWRADSGNTYPDVWPTWLDVVSPVYPEP